MIRLAILELIGGWVLPFINLGLSYFSLLFVTFRYLALHIFNVMLEDEACLFTSGYCDGWYLLLLTGLITY